MQPVVPEARTTGCSPVTEGIHGISLNDWAAVCGLEARTLLSWFMAWYFRYTHSSISKPAAAACIHLSCACDNCLIRIYFSARNWFPRYCWGWKSTGLQFSGQFRWNYPQSAGFIGYADKVQWKFCVWQVSVPLSSAYLSLNLSGRYDA